jgi:hypothetical protein
MGSRGRKPCFFVPIKLEIYDFIKNIHLRGSGDGGIERKSMNYKS